MSDSEEISDVQDDKDEDFKIDEYEKEIDSDDSYCDTEEINDQNKTSEGNQKGAAERSENTYVGPILPGGHRFDRKFVCIKYPGNIINSDKALETLGGICNISKAVETQNRRLELRFRPDDAYCKPACGDRHKTTGFLLRVRVKKSRCKKAEESTAKKPSTDESLNDSSLEVQNNESRLSEVENTEDKNPEEQAVSELVEQVQNCSVSEESVENSISENKDVSDSLRNNENVLPTFDHNKYEDLSEDQDYRLPKLKVLGRVDMEFRFTNLCDFQYLPLTQSKENPKKLDCVYEKIYPVDLPHHSWLRNDVPYFLPPAAFSRMDSVQQYVPKTEISTLPENIIGKNRKRKAGFTNYIYFSTPDVPTKPPAGIETAMKVKFVQNVHYQQMIKIFEERPIWSKNALMYVTKFTTDRLKILLPAVAYYFMTGPWKIMWVRLGYDPRKDSSARKYQTLDYRLKAMHGLGSTVKCKRNYAEYTLPYKSAPASKQKTTILSAALRQDLYQKKEQDWNENVYIYREGTVPPSRQMFYQYCDVLVDEIQEMLAKLPDPLPGTRCHEKRGWLPNGFDVQCREIINKQVRTVLRKQMNIPDDHPTSLPRKRRASLKLKLSKLKKKRRRRKKKNESNGEESDHSITEN